MKANRHVEPGNQKRGGNGAVQHVGHGGYVISAFGVGTTNNRTGDKHEQNDGKKCQENFPNVNDERHWLKFKK